MEIIAATNNKHKLEEIKEILSEIDYEVYSLEDVGINIEVKETGSTFEENALIKAREICKLTGQISIADDSGLEVEILDGRPGVYSARYAGVNGENRDKANNIKLLEELKDVSEDKRNARFYSVIAIVFPDGQELTTRGYIKGKIGYEEKGDNGFGYDPIFIIDGLDKTMAEIGMEEKNKISHRANALKKMKSLLTKP